MFCTFSRTLCIYSHLHTLLYITIYVGIVITITRTSVYIPTLMYILVLFHMGKLILYIMQKPLQVCILSRLHEQVLDMAGG